MASLVRDPSCTHGSRPQRGLCSCGYCGGPLHLLRVHGGVVQRPRARRWAGLSRVGRRVRLRHFSRLGSTALRRNRGVVAAAPNGLRTTRLPHKPRTTGSLMVCVPPRTRPLQPAQSVRRWVSVGATVGYECTAPKRAEKPCLANGYAPASAAPTSYDSQMQPRESYAPPQSHHSQAPPHGSYDPYSAPPQQQVGVQAPPWDYKTSMPALGVPDAGNLPCR